MESYYEKMEQLRAQYAPILEQLKNHQIPDAYPEAELQFPFFQGRSLNEGSLYFREEINRLCGFCFLSYNWIRPLATWIGDRQCLEIMCGSGALSFALRSCGTSIIATDDHSWEKNYPDWFQAPWTEIEKLDCLQAIEKYGRQTDLLLCSWPYRDDSCYQALLKMREVNPSMKMIYIGEPAGQATASDHFFDAMEEVDDDSFYQAVASFLPAYTIHDAPMLIK